MPIKAKKLFFWGTGIVLLGTKITTCTKLAMSDTIVASLGTKVALTDTKFSLTCINVNLMDTRVVMSHDTKIGLSRTKIAMSIIEIAPPGNNLVYQAQTLLSQVLKWHRWAP
jgi:hydrogenase maturation factor